MVDNLLKQTMSNENCFFNYFFVEKYPCMELKEKFQHQVIKPNFITVMETEGFLNLDVRQVMEWATSDDVTAVLRKGEGNC